MKIAQHVWDMFQALFQLIRDCDSSVVVCWETASSELLSLLDLCAEEHCDHYDKSGCLRAIVLPKFHCEKLGTLVIGPLVDPKSERFSVCQISWLFYDMKLIADLLVRKHCREAQDDCVMVCGVFVKS